MPGTRCGVSAHGWSLERPKVDCFSSAPRVAQEQTMDGYFVVTGHILSFGSVVCHRCIPVAVWSIPTKEVCLAEGGLGDRSNMANMMSVVVPNHSHRSRSYLLPGQGRH